MGEDDTDPTGPIPAWRRAGCCRGETPAGRADGGRPGDRLGAGAAARFVDYLYLGITNSMAFSPPDVMPLAAWAKAMMAVQSVVSLLILGLIVARAVNVVA